MAFEKIILGEKELFDFEKLLVNDGIIKNVHPDLSSFSEDIMRESKKTWNNKKNRRRLLLSLMLFEKFDAVTLSSFDLSPLVEDGLIDKGACVTIGTDDNHPTSIIVDSVWRYEQSIMTSVFRMTKSLFKMVRIDINPKPLITEEETMGLCEAFLFGTQEDFLNEYRSILKVMLHNWVKRIYSGSVIYYGPMMLSGDEESIIIDYILTVAAKKIDKIYSILDRIPCEKESLLRYYSLREELDSNNQVYSISPTCLSCSHNWKTCCENSEFIYNASFDCFDRENIGKQRYAKFNGLILSSYANAALYDNSIKFQANKGSNIKVIEDLYHIVNVDMSKLVESIPEPQNAREAIRMRNKPEIESFRNILNHWSECLLNGDINESEYIQKDFDDARKYFEKKEVDNRKKSSIFHCFFEALGNQIPYISNVVGVISPFVNRKRILDETKHRWFLLTR